LHNSRLHAWRYADHFAHYRLIWLGCGSEDLFFGEAKALAGRLQAANIDEPIQVVAYDTRWPGWFADDAAEVRLVNISSAKAAVCSKIGLAAAPY